jgi:hypothetical protein
MRGDKKLSFDYSKYQEQLKNSKKDEKTEQVHNVLKKSIKTSKVLCMQHVAFSIVLIFFRKRNLN